jgi:DNA-binding winged helix-turn-helix (wHTH) protein
LTGSPRVLLFPPFRLDLDEGRLWKDAEQVTLRAKQFAVLAFLAGNPRRLVTRDELQDAVWRRASVSDGLVRNCIYDLRRAIGEGVIETVPGRGYRFLPALASDPPEDADRRAHVSELTASIVGRDADLQTLRACLAQALGARRSVVLVTGEPGIGKTTLLRVFLEGAAGLADLRVVRGQCVEQYGAGEPYMPILQGLARLRRSGDDRVTAHLRQYAPTWLAQMPGVTDAELEATQSQPHSATQGRMLRELSEVLEHLSLEAPIVVVLEDLQWSDPSTVEALSLLGQRREPARLMVVGTCRPGELQAHPLRKIIAELRAHNQGQVVPLGLLDTALVGEYLASRFPIDTFPADLASEVHRMTGGNPLFMVSTIDDWIARRFVVQSGGAWTLQASLEEMASRTPESVTQLIDIQFDRFPASWREVLSAAAVVGAEFAVGLVAAALETSEEAVEDVIEEVLRTQTFLRRSPTEEWPDGTLQPRYGFVHALYRDALHARTTTARRHAWHQRVGMRLEAGYGDRAAEIASELAARFERSRDWDRAVRYFGLAGERALQRFARFEAVGHFRAGLVLVEKLPAGETRDRRELTLLTSLAAPLAVILGYRGVELDEVIERARALAERARDLPRLVTILACEELSCVVSGRYESAERVVTAMERAAGAYGSTDLQVHGAIARARLARYKGDLLSARAALAKAEEIAALTDPRSAVHDAVIVTWGARAVIEWLLGYPDRAMGIFTETSGLLGPLANRRIHAGGSLDGIMTLSRTPWLGWSLFAQLHVMRRDFAATLEAADKLDETGREVQDSTAAIYRVWVACCSQGPGADVAPLRDAVVSTLGPNPALSPLFYAMLADACVRAHDVAKGLAATDAGLAFGEAVGARCMEPELYRLEGALLRDTSRGRAVSSCRRALALARATSSRSFELRAALDLVDLCTDAAARSKAIEDLAGTYASFTEGFDDPDLGLARALLAADPKARI